MRTRFALRSVLVPGLGILALGCAQLRLPPVPEPQLRREIPPLSSNLLPRSMSTPDPLLRTPTVRLLETTRFTLNVRDADLRGLLLGLGQESPLNIVVGPGVDGTVTADLDDVSLLQVLDQVVAARGFRYQVRENMIHIFRSDRDTRIYQVDYPSYQRSASADVSLTGFIASGSGSDEGSSSGGEDTSLSAISTRQEQDFWSELNSALSIIVYGPSGPSEEQGGEDGDASEGHLQPERLIVSPQSGLVTVSAETAVLDEVEAHLNAIRESISRQVLIDARFVEVTLSDSLDLGVDYEWAADLGAGTGGVFTRLINPGGDLANFSQNLAPSLSDGGFAFGIARDNLGVILTALATQTDVNVVSTPKIATLNNHKALIKVVRNEIFFIGETETVVNETTTLQTTEFTPRVIPVGVTLDVTPQISEAGYVTLHVKPSVSEIVDVIPQPAGSPGLPDLGSLPVIDLREADTVLRVPDTTTIVIGGLVRSREFERERRVPVLGDIPYIGAAFRSTRTEERRTELIIFLTPTILDAPRVARIGESSLIGLEALDNVRDVRSLTRPWWRYPWGQSYGVSP